MKRWAEGCRPRPATDQLCDLEQLISTVVETHNVRAVTFQFCLETYQGL